MRTAPSAPLPPVGKSPLESALYGGALLGILGWVGCAAAVSCGYPMLLGVGPHNERLLLIAVAVLPSVLVVAMPGPRGGPYFFLRLGWLLAAIAAVLVPGRGFELLFWAPLVAGLPACGAALLRLWMLSRRRRR